MPPDRPLTPAERAVIADLEKRLLLHTPVPERSAAGIRADVARAVRGHPAAARRPRGWITRQLTVPVVALVGTTAVLLLIAALVGVSVLGAAAVVASVLATALVWRLLPADLGGPVRPPKPPSRGRNPWLSRPR